MTPVVTDADLIALALGQTAPAERERIEAWLRADEGARRARYDAIRRHLGRYDVLTAAEAAPALSSAALVARLSPRRTRRRRLVPATAAALAVALIVVALLVPRAPSARGIRAGEGVLRVGPQGTSSPANGRLEPGARVTAPEVAEVDLGERGRIVLDGGTVLTLTRANEVTLNEGRAFFDLGPGPFVVRTALGDVDVLGTAFEVDLRGDGLQVAVEHGRVRVGDHVLAAGSRWAGGMRHDGGARPGAFFRRPRLDLAVPGPVRARGGASLSLLLTNPTPVAFTVGEPEDVRAPVWLTIRGPDGAVRDQALTGVVEQWGLARGDHTDLGLPARTTRRADLVLENAFAEPGRYRCRAMYRPRGEAPVVSTELHIEVVE